MNKLQLTNYFLKCLFAFNFVLYTLTGNTTNYYVSSSGNDSNPGTSEDFPWRSLEKVNNFFKLNPGDQILFNRGDEWIGGIKVRASGTVDYPIVYGAYGIGEDPKFYGSEPIIDWTLHKGTIYKANFNNAISQLFINDSKIQFARYPNTGYFGITEVSNSTQFISTDLNAEINYKGAIWIARTSAYSMYSKYITASSSQKLTIESTPWTEKLTTDIGFFLCNKLEFIDSPGEWYYDTNTNTVYVWTPNNDSPENYVVRGSISDYGVYITNKKYITIKDLEILHSSADGIFIDNSDYVTIDNCKIISPAKNGIVSSNSATYSIIKNNYISNPMDSGIRLSGNQGADINNNSVTGAGLLENFNLNENFTTSPGEGIYLTGGNMTVTYNRIIDSGHCGIKFSKGVYEIKYNYINGACQVLDDGGGIYTYNGSDYTKPGVAGSEITNNIVLNVFGNRAGTQRTKDDGNGIYMDNNTHDVLIENNTVAHTTCGIFLHQNGKMTIKGNTVMDAILLLNTDEVKDSYISKNIIYTTNRIGDYTWWQDTYQRIVYQSSASAKFDYNTYISHYYVKSVFVNFADFAAWKAATGQDANSTCDVSSLAEGETENLYYNNTKQAITFYLGKSFFRDVYGKKVSDTFSLEPFTSKILIGKNFDNINRRPTVSDQSFNIQSPRISNDFVGQVFAHDPDTGQILSYSIDKGNENGWFVVDSINGKIFVLNDIQTSKDISIELIVRVTDNSVNPLSDSAKVIINIEGSDTSPPVISSFSIPLYAISLTVPLTSFNASDDVAITGYLLSESPDKPFADDIRWTTSILEDFTFLDEGIRVLYAWAKDSAGNVSDFISNTIAITLPDMSPVFSVYLFEESSYTNVIDSQGSNDGNIVNEGLRVDGVIGNGVELTGSGYINLGHSFGENVQNEVTLSVWIKPISTNENYQSIIMHGGPNIYSYALYIHPDSNGIIFKTTGTTNSELRIDNIHDLWNGDWHNIVATYNGFEKIIYLDGKVVKDAQTSGVIESGWGYNLLVGAGNDETSSLTSFYKGLIDEVKIYNYALSDAEISESYLTINKVIKKIATTENISICDGDEYLGWTEPGIYNRVLQRVQESASGADSIVTTTLQVYPSYTENREVTICDGETYNLGKQILNSTGEYIEGFKSILGCDSTIILKLFVNPVYNATENITISPGDNYFGWTEEGTYQRNFISTSGCDSTIVTNLTFAQTLTQFIYLEKGWNIFSSYLIPTNNSMDSVMEKLRTDGNLVKVQDELDNTYEKLNNQTEWLNNIGSLEQTEGYKIRVESDYNLEVAGRQINIPLNVEIKKGLNLISFPINGSLDAMQVLEPLINSGILEKVQDEKGNSVENWGEFGWINGIGNFISGEGYILYAIGNGVLTINEIKEKSNAFFSNGTETNHFKLDFEGNGFEHMNINAFGLNEIQLKSGDEIAVFDGKLCVGALKLTEKNFTMNTVSIPASASDADIINGFIDGNPIVLKLWKHDSNTEFELLPDLIKGEMLYNKHASVFIKFKEISDIVDDIDIYPNPANNKVNIRFYSLPKNGAKILLFNITGKKILTLDVQSNIETINIENLQAGIYFIETNIGNKSSKYKLIVI